jgi:hypothetical protein
MWSMGKYTAHARQVMMGQHDGVLCAEQCRLRCNGDLIWLPTVVLLIAEVFCTTVAFGRLLGEICGCRNCCCCFSSTDLFFHMLLVC